MIRGGCLPLVVAGWFGLRGATTGGVVCLPLVVAGWLGLGGATTGGVVCLPLVVAGGWAKC